MAVKKKTSTKKAAKKKATTKNATQSQDICFAVMPFGGWFDDYYTSIYCPAIQSAGLTPFRADDLYRPSTIVNDIWSYTKKAKLILADLTGKNANVFYELGLAHALAKPAILVVENMGDVPFDLRALRVIEYNKNAPNWGDVLKGKIEASIKEVLDAPAQSVLPAFLDVKETAKKPTVTEKEKELIEMRQDIDMMRRELLLSSTRSGIEEIDPDTAEALIMSYMKRGTPRNMVARRLSDRGVPVVWVEDKIDELAKENAAIAKRRTRRKTPIPRKVTPKKKSVAKKKK